MEGLSAKWKGLDEKQQKTYGGAGAVVAVVVLYIVFFWTPSCASSKSCAELKALYGGWDLHNPGQRGDVTVCGESDNGFGPGGTTQCYGGTNSVRFPAPKPAPHNRQTFWREMAKMANANGGALRAQNGATAAVQDDSRPGWEHANDICRTAGGRLCTVAELLNEVTRGTGCQHDAEMTWSSEACDHWGITGHITAQGGQHRGDEACPDECHGNGWSTGGNSAGQDCATCECTPRCAPDDNTHAVRCCADADPTEAKAKCEAYVGYKGQLKNPPPASNTMDEIGREATTTAASALCQSSSSCYELQGLFGGWPVGATSDQIRAGQVTNAAGGYTHGGSQGYSTSGFNGNNNHLERHESGVCGESDNGLGEADEQGKRTNQCFGGEGGASNRAHLI